MSEERRAVILAGGRGTRLKPYTVVLPKPLMPIGEYPILEVIIRQLARHGFSRVTLAVNHQAKLIQSFFEDGRAWGVTIDYSLEDQSLSTIGPLRLIPDLPENFLVMNGDVLTDMDYREFFDEHAAGENLFTLAAHRRRQTSEYGVLTLDESNRLVGFEEKPTVELDVSMGIYMANREILSFIPEDQPYGFDHLMKDLIDAGRYPQVKPYRGYWLDIGREEDYARAIQEFDLLQKKFLQGGPESIENFLEDRGKITGQRP